LLRLRIHLLREGQFISDYDAHIAERLAFVLSGGDVLDGTLVSEEELLGLEREAFLSLCGERSTQERIAYTLKTGKSLRN
jgi:3-hydroxyacyl-CoA dehydrogenase